MGVNLDRTLSAARDQHPSLVVACELPTSGLQFQPRVVGLIALLGIALQAPAVFLALSAALWWCTLLPRLNPFEALYNATFARRAGATRIGITTAPRRFSQGMAATFAVAIAIALLLKWPVAAVAFEAMFVAATGAAAIFGYCAGCFVYHLLHGRPEPARQG